MPEESPQENANLPADNHDQVNMAGNEKNNLTDRSKTPEKPNQPETVKNMEVYHPHGNHHERKLKDYFFEFFMLFLAVTAGFFMENMRESYVDNHKEHQYISRLITDLQEDTTTIKGIINGTESQIKSIDSLLTLLENPVSEINMSKLYNYVNKYLNNLSMFSVREVTITQLRNSSALRLIDNKSASDSIVYYYETYESHAEQQKYNYKILQELIELEMKIFDLSAYRVKGRKMTFDASRTKEFYNRIIMYNSMLGGEVDWLKAYQMRGVALLKHLKVEYRLAL